MSELQSDFVKMVGECSHLGIKHNAFIRRSKLTDELYYTINDEVRSTMDWNVIYSDLLELEN